MADKGIPYIVRIIDRLPRDPRGSVYLNLPMNLWIPRRTGQRVQVQVKVYVQVHADARLEGPMGIMSLKDFGTQAGLIADAAGDGGEASQGKMGAIRMNGGAMRGIHLDVI